MRDGKTQRMAHAGRAMTFDDFRERYRARLVVIDGPQLGDEFELDRSPTTLGRGPGADLCFANPAMSRQHAAIEFTADGFRIRDLGSTNGVRIDGRTVPAAELGHGARFELGDQTFQLVLERCEERPETYEIIVDA